MKHDKNELTYILSNWPCVVATILSGKVDDFDHYASVSLSGSRGVSSFATLLMFQ